MLELFMVTEAQLGIIIVGFMLLMLFLGMRVAYAAAIAGFVGLVWKGLLVQDSEFGQAFTVALEYAGGMPYSKISKSTLTLIPIFILIGFLAYHAGLTRALFDAARKWLGWLPGGMAVATVFSTAGFAAVSGASVATSAVFARIAIPEMLKLNYDKRFAAGVVAAGGTLASLIPPSAILVIYAIIAEQDVGALLMAGFLPGAVSAVIYGVLVVVLAMNNPKLGPPSQSYPLSERIASLWPTTPIIFVIAVIFTAVYGGWASAAEAGALGAFVIFCVAYFHGMTRKNFGDALLESSKLTAMIFAIIWSVYIFVLFLGNIHLPDAFAEWIGNLDQSVWVTLILILLAYAVLGMFMDAIGMLLLTLPVVLPALVALNAAPTDGVGRFGMTDEACQVWFGILVVKMAEFCLITPPIGLNCFVVAGVRKDLSVQDVFRGVTPFFVADLITIAILFAFPMIVLWLPEVTGTLALDPFEGLGF